MAYTNVNFKTKKEFKEAVARGDRVTLFQPAGIGTIPENGEELVEGPHYPKPHTWYATAKLENGVVTKVT